MSRFTKSSNPAMNSALKKMQGENTLNLEGQEGAGVMTIQGAINKTFMLIALMILVAAVSFNLAVSGSPAARPLMMLGIFGSLGVAIFTTIKPKYSAITAPLYAALEGLAVGVVTAIYMGLFDGIVFKAVSLTIGILLLMLLIYKSGLIKVTQKFRMAVVAATGAIFLMYIVTWILGMFGMSVPFLHDGGTISIVITLGIIVVASLNLLLDFDFFERGAAAGAPKYMEWYAGFGLLITLVWLYFEILRLLSYFAGE